MKTKTITTFFILLFLNCFSQNNKTCNSADEIIEDLNTISINKCNINDTKKSTNTRSIKTSSDKISYHIRKNKTYTKSKTKELLFTVVDEIPLFKKCTNSKDKKCFNKEFYKHFAKNFIPERASLNGIKGKIFISFTIMSNGTVSKTLISSRKKSYELTKEVKRVINKLPLFKTGIHKGLPVNVRYNIPINLTKD